MIIKESLVNLLATSVNFLITQKLFSLLEQTRFRRQTEVVGEKNLNPEFLTLKRDFEQPNCPLMEDKVYKFEFRKFDKQFESYYGKTAKVRYFVRVIIKRKMSSNVVREQDLAVLCSSSAPEGSQAIKMEVGIEDCLHIVFDYSRDTYHLKDCIYGKVKFSIVKIRIKNMEMCVVKRETTGSGTNSHTDNDTIVKYEIMDGSPVRGRFILGWMGLIGCWGVEREQRRLFRFGCT